MHTPDVLVHSVTELKRIWKGHYTNMWIRKLPLLPTIVTLLCVVIMFGLGIWQLERKAQKDVRLMQIEERQSSRPYKLEELSLKRSVNINNSDINNNTSYTKNLDIQDVPLSFVGTAQMENLFFIDNKIVSGKTGYQVVIPVATLDNDIILANLGWLRGSGLRGQLPSVSDKLKDELTERSMQFTGVVSFPSINPMVSETNRAFGQFPALLQQTDMVQMKQHLNAAGLLRQGKLYPFIVNLTPEESSEFVRNWQPVVMSPEKHLGYAVQWFGLGIAALTIYILSLMKLFQTKNNKEN